MVTTGCVRKNGNRFWTFMWSFVMLSPINGKTSKKNFNKPDSEQMCQHGTRFQRRYLDWRATVIENATHIASERIHSTASSDQINNYKHVRNRLFERNKIGRTYLWTKFAKLSLPKIVGRALSEGWASEVLSRKFLKTLCRADENSKRAATMTCTGQTFHQREKGMESWGLCVSRLCFGSILNLEMS